MRAGIDHGECPVHCDLAAADSAAGVAPMSLSTCGGVPPVVQGGFRQAGVWHGAWGRVQVTCKLPCAAVSAVASPGVVGFSAGLAVS